MVCILSGAYFRVDDMGCGILMDTTAFYVATFVSSLVVGLFIRAIDHMFKALFGSRKRSNVMD